MATPGQPYTREETLSLISEKARTASDRFRINIFRRSANGGMSQVAAFNGATFTQIAEPAAWLPPVLGGGNYLLKVSHSTEQPGTLIGSPLEEAYDSKPDSPAGPSKNTPSLKVMNAPSWPGPPDLLFPSRELIEADQIGKHPFSPGAASPRAILVASQPQAGYESLPQASSPQFVPQDNQGLLAAALAKEAETARIREETERRSRELDERQARIERENTERAEALKRAESESRLREEMRARDAEFKVQLAALAKPVEPQKAISITEIMAAATPIITLLIQTQQESARLAREATEKAAAAQMEVLKAVTAKPSMSPEMQMLIETLKDDKKSGSADAMATMMTRMVDAVGVVSKMSIGMIETIADQMGGDPEDPMVTAIKEGAKAMAMLSQGSQAGASKLIPGAPRAALPAQQSQAPLPKPQPPPARPPAPRPAPPRPAGAVATGPQAMPLAQAQQQGFAEMTPEVVGPADARSTVDLLEAAIRGLHNPGEVAQTLVTLIQQKDPALRAELDAANGDPSVLIGNRLGAEFIFAHKDYLDALGDNFEKLGEAAGLFEDAGATVQEAVAGAVLPDEPTPA